MSQRRLSRNLLLFPFLLLVFFMLVGNLSSRFSADSAPSPFHRRMGLAVREETHTVTLTPEDARDFERAMASLTTQAKILIVAEGVPLKWRPDVRTIDRMTRTQSASVAVQALAQAYDYVVSPALANQRDGAKTIFLLKKRYTDPQDIPAITLEEYRLALNDIQTLVQPYLPAPPIQSKTRFVQDFARTLSPDQVSLLERGQLAPAHLTTKQQNEVYRMLLQGYTNTILSDVANVTRTLNSTRGYSIGFCQNAGKETLGLYAKSSGDGGVFCPLEDARTAKNAVALQDSTVADTVRYQTLNSVTQRLGHRGYQGRRANREYVFQIDSALAEKPVSISGENNVSAKDVFEALARVYGLSVRREKQGERQQALRIVRPSLKTAKDINEMADAVCAALPDPLMRAAQGNPSFSTYAQGTGDYRPTLERIQQRMVCAGQRLHTALEERRRKQTKPGTLPDLPVPIAALRSEERFALNMILAKQMFRCAVSSWGTGTPALVTHWKESTLSGGPYKERDTNLFAIRAHYTDWNNVPYSSGIAAAL